MNAIPSNEQQFRLSKINEVKDYFLAEIRERELISRNLSKYIASLDYFNKSLNVLSVLSGSIYIASFPTIIGVPAGIIGARLRFYVFNYIRTSKKVFKNSQN